MTQARVAAAVNRGNEQLKSAEKLPTWDLQQAQVNSTMDEVGTELSRIEREMSGYEGANKKGIDAAVALGGKVFYDNAHSVWKETLYPYESDNFGKEGHSLDYVASVAKYAAGFGVGVPAFMAFLWGGTLLAEATTGGAAWLTFGEAIGVGLVGGGMAALLVAGGGCLYKAGDYIYMRATNDDIKDVPNCE
jgi:hypothetical protein